MGFKYAAVLFLFHFSIKLGEKLIRMNDQYSGIRRSSLSGYVISKNKIIYIAYIKNMLSNNAIC